jgi:hypothetical protein
VAHARLDARRLLYAQIARLLACIGERDDLLVWIMLVDRLITTGSSR